MKRPPQDALQSLIAMPRLTTLKSRRRTGRWLMDFKRDFLYRNPLCSNCSTDDMPVLAEEVDHKVALINGGVDFDEDPNQAQGLCKTCHKEKTDRDMGYRKKPKIGLDGWPEDAGK